MGQPGSILIKLTHKSLAVMAFGQQACRMMRGPDEYLAKIGEAFFNVTEYRSWPPTTIRRLPPALKRKALQDGTVMILDDYLIILEAEKGYSAHTLRAYFTDIKSFILFFLDTCNCRDENWQQAFEKSIQQVDKMIVRRYLAAQTALEKS